jgi:hypothetical protein
MDLLSFEYGDAIPSPYFTLEDELAETKKKLQRLEAKYKKNKEQTKQRWKQMENRLDEMVTLKEEKEQYLNHLQKKYTSLEEEHDKRLKQLEDKFTRVVAMQDDLSEDVVSIVPCIDPNGQLQLYDLHCSEIKITTKSNQVFLSMDGKLFCNILFFMDDNNLRLLKQNRYMESLQIEITGPTHRDSHTNPIHTLVKVCDALLYNTDAVNKGDLEVLFKCVHMDLHSIQEMIKLFKKSSTVYTYEGKESSPYKTYSSFVIELNQYYQREIDEMKAHCTANDITFDCI